VVDLPLSVTIDPSLTGLVDGAVSYETGLTRAQAADPHLYAYEHHGHEFTATDPGAFSSFYEDVILGRPMPLQFATSRIRGIDTLFAITLFLHRDLATHPAMAATVAAVDLVHRRGLPMFGHVEPDLGRFFRLLAVMFPEGLSKGEQGDRLRAVVGWIYEYITNGALPHLGAEPPSPKVLQEGSNGFVVAEVTTDMYAGWVELFRAGHLRGVVVERERDGRRRVLASRKSVFVPFNLTRAAEILNKAERILGEEPGWTADELWLRSPEEGTLVLVSHLVEVFLRV